MKPAARVDKLDTERSVSIEQAENSKIMGETV